jgi:hypothetical protein
MNQERNRSHNFNSCIYNTQGKIICQNNKKNINLPLLLEGFINVTPNQKESDCVVLNKKLSSIFNSYNCDATIKNTEDKCQFNYKCNKKTNNCSIINKTATPIISNYNCSSSSVNNPDDNDCTFNFDCFSKKNK